MFNKFNKYFNFFDIDGHYLIIFFGIQIRIKHKQKYTIPTVKEYGVTTEKRKAPIVASLTTFKDRINLVHIAIKSILVQDLKPDYLVLYLSSEEFLNKENDLPKSLLDLKKYGLEIRWCDDNIRSYKKLIPALNDFKESIFITFDDDIIYAKDTISTLYNKHLENPNTIISIRSARLEIKNNKLYNMSIKNRLFDDYSKPSFLNRLTGCAGVLYPLNCFYKDVLNKDIFYNLIPTHDDVWFWAMATLNRVKVINVKGIKSSITTIDNSQSFGLCKVNNSKFGMSTQDAYDIIIKKYPEILKQLTLEKE